MNSSQPPTLELFGHQYCHLCGDMQRALEALATSLRFKLVLVDIEGRPDLEARFGERVPVLHCEGVEVCHYFLDEAALRAHLAPARGGR